jgi:hypothetical protein
MSTCRHEWQPRADSARIWQECARCGLEQDVGTHDEILARAVADIMRPDSIESIRKVALEPNDVIVIRYAKRLSPDAYDGIGEWMRETFPHHKVIVCDHETTIEVLHDPQGGG